ncbi:pseudouridylate synthase TRUB1-like isoform X2 [Antedon mediterranea]|uniref:pseudouridylate synthase TRUB1-like isoform X2 n=1 Tax=Antedon mediterranea TaxID=105859 RepID=UPI003AF9B9A5
MRRLLNLNGLIAVNKPPGVTCSDLLDNIKTKLFNEISEALPLGIRRQFKIGHGGTLDKNAEGVLVLGIGSATKNLTQVLKGNKKYEAIGCLGSATNTYDSSGTVVCSHSYSHVSREDLEKALETFRGNILQVPPIYSALKLNGKRMSDLAHRGQHVDPKPARPVTVHSLECTHFSSPQFNLTLHCGGGFYVRSLIHDLGKYLHDFEYSELNTIDIELSTIELSTIELNTIELAT